MKTGLIYARVSTGKQDLDRQLHECREFAKWNKIEIIEEFVAEGVSGKSADRPVLDKAIRFARKVDCFIVAESSRVTRRNVRDLLYYIGKIEHGCCVFKSVCEPEFNTEDIAIRDVFLTLRAFQNKVEGDKISERTRAKYRAKKAHAKALGKKVKWGRKRFKVSEKEINRAIRECWSCQTCAEEWGCSKTTAAEILKVFRYAAFYEPESCV